MQAGGAEPLFVLAHSPSAWLRTQASDTINLLGYVPPRSVMLASAAMTPREEGGVHAGGTVFGAITARKQRHTLQKSTEVTAAAAAPSAVEKGTPRRSGVQPDRGGDKGGDKTSSARPEKKAGSVAVAVAVAAEPLPTSKIPGRLISPLMRHHVKSAEPQPLDAME